MIQIKERGTTQRTERAAAVTYLDHQPGDSTRYEIVAVDLAGGSLHLGDLGYVSQDAVLVVCGLGGRAYLFRHGDDVAEWYVEEKLGLKNPHTVHHITELIANAIGGNVVACDHDQVAGMTHSIVDDRVQTLPNGKRILTLRCECGQEFSSLIEPGRASRRSARAAYRRHLDEPEVPA